MALQALIPIAASIGAPIVRDLLARKLGPMGADIAEEVINKIAEHAGVQPDYLPELLQQDPVAVKEAIAEVEGSPELVRLYADGLKAQMELQQAEMKGPLWSWAWRPLGMYMLGFLWLWAIVIAHGLNAVFKIALPPPDLSVLLQLTAAYMALYMGGHTVKDVVGKMKGAS